MTQYAAVSVTEFYGPDTRYAILSIHETIDTARAVADRHDPDYDSKVDARRLGHNQASPTRGEVMEVITDNYDERDEVEYREKGYVVSSDEQGNVYVLAEIGVQ